MRVIAGQYRRRRLKSLPGTETRPMLDRMRETLFNVLAGEIEGKSFVDLYAGTGAVGIEALSRGAAQVIFVEKDPRAARVIEENLAHVGARHKARLLRFPVRVVLPQLTADVFFLGPPYELSKEYETTLNYLGSSPPELVIAQHARSHPLAEQYGRLRLVRRINVGNNSLSFYREE